MKISSVQEQQKKKTMTDYSCDEEEGLQAIGETDKTCLKEEK